MLGRRAILFAACLLAACSSPAPAPATAEPIWLHILPAGEEYELRVDGQVVDLANLERALINHGLAANPNLTDDEVRQQVRIFVRAHPSAPRTWQRDLEPIFRRFSRIGMVPADRPS